jgi:hypothetical protein
MPHKKHTRDKSPGKDPSQHWTQKRQEQQSQTDPAIEGSGQRAGHGKGQETGLPDLGQNDEPRGHAHSGGRG